MPTTLSSDRYSAVSSSSTCSTSSNSSYHNNPRNSSSSQSSSTFIPLRSATSSFHLSKINSNNSRSMQSLKIQQQYKAHHTPVARISPLVINQQFSTNDLAKKSEKDDGWISCEELETIEKRFTDLLQEPNEKKPIILNNYQQRSNSCDRLDLDEKDFKKPSKFFVFFTHDTLYFVLFLISSST